jgi:hypothetical protein
MDFDDLRASPKIMQFLYLTGLVVLIWVIYMFRHKGPLRSKLRNSLSDNKAIVTRQERSDPRADRNERGLNVIFQFNGHDFDAYEVLGIPAGSQWPAVEVAYEKMLKKFAGEPAGSDEIYHHAFNAIRRSIG